MAGWIELACRIPATVYPALEVALQKLGAEAITSAEGDTEIFGEPGLVHDEVWKTFLLTALFADSTDRALVTRAVHAIAGPDITLVFTSLAEQVWAESWKDHWRPQAFAGGLWVCPSWCEPPAQARHVLRLDPGRAFGTGTHETTALCLDWLALTAALAGCRVIDYGCGSAILALAAVCFGAEEVAAVDIDDDALAVARDNIALNGYTLKISVARPDTLTTGRAEVLVANILQEPLLALASRFHELLVPGGRVALSGLLGSQVARVLDVYRERFTMDPPQIRGEWALVSGVRR